MGPVSGHPMHGTKPLAQKLMVRLADGPRCGIELWKVLYRNDKSEAYRHEKVDGKKAAEELAEDLRAVFDDVIFSRL
jgi:hypothetical protein